MELDKNRYYGIAWNYEEDAYRRTGLLSNITKFEDGEDIIFLHTSIKKQLDGNFKMSKMYCRQQFNDKEVGIDISDLPLPGFELYPESLALSLLYVMEGDIFMSFKKDGKMKETYDGLVAKEEVVKYDIPDLNRIKQLMTIWSPIQWHAYIADLYEGLKVRDKEIEELNKK